ncbi:uncharacterized protein LOC121386967 isoform X2 [Gigantopelta aegis]|nr:uncharacterized protein LOC121386967 isoform X2 [Gigantopelta aegis]
MYYAGGSECYPMSPLPTDYTFNCTYDIFTLTINSVNISQHRTVWRCGFKRGRPESNTIVLEVRDGPGSKILMDISCSLFPEERNDVTLSCVADCFLRCDYTWKFNDKTIGNTSILSIFRNDKTQTGTYTCTAVNPDIGKSANATVYVGVQCLSDKVHSRFAAGFGSGIGTALLLIVLTGAAAFVYFWLKKSGKWLTQETNPRETTEHAAFYNIGQASDHQQEPNARPEVHARPEAHARPETDTTPEADTAPENNSTYYSSLNSPDAQNPSYDVLTFGDSTKDIYEDV